MTEFDKLDINKDNSVSRDEFALLELENRRRVLDDEDSKRDMQRAVVYFLPGRNVIVPVFYNCHRLDRSE